MIKPRVVSDQPPAIGDGAQTAAFCFLFKKERERLIECEQIFGCEGPRAVASRHCTVEQ
jgi:hypothetical protein